MAVYPGSRFVGCTSAQFGGGRLVVGERSPYGYHAHPDNRLHDVLQSDTLPQLAAMYFAPLLRACGYWWAIADFQPGPRISPLMALHLQRQRIIVPALRVLTDIILHPGVHHGR